MVQPRTGVIDRCRPQGARLAVDRYDPGRPSRTLRAPVRTPRPDRLAAPTVHFLRSLPALVRRRPVISGVLVLIVLLGGAMRFDAIGSSERVSVDERSYLGIANNMVKYRTYAYGSDPIHWGPGTPFLFAGAMKLTGTSAISDEPGGKNVALYAQAFVGTLTILAVFAFAAWLGGPLAGLLAALMTAIYDPLVLVARSYLSEPLGGLMLVLALFAIAFAVSKPRASVKLALGAGALLGGAFLARNDMLLLGGVLPALIILLFWHRSGWKRPGFLAGLRLGVLIGIGSVIVISPWVIYASLEEKKFVPITTAGPSSLWVATYLPAGGRQIILKRQFMDEVCKTFPDREDACGVSATDMDMRLIFELLHLRHPEAATQKEAIQLELDRNIRDYAFGQPLQFAEMLANKSTRIWGKPWGGGTLGRMESSIWQHRILLGGSLLGIIAGIAFGGRRRKYVLLGVTALLAVTALNTIFVSESRMSLRMTPLLFAVGVGGAGAALRARRGDDEPDAVAGSDPEPAPAASEPADESTGAGADTAPKTGPAPA